VLAQVFKSINPVFIALIAVAWLATAAQSEVRQWQLGSEGLSWRDNELNSTAISFSAPGAIQLVGFNPNDNIVRLLNWSEGFPQDFVSEVAEARVWDNVPFKQSNIPLVDGDPTTSSENRFKDFGVLQAGRSFFFDLGTRFPVNRLAFFPRPEGGNSRGRPYSDDFIRSYKLQVNDGTHFNQQNLPIYNLLTQVDFTNENTAEIRFPLQFVRYVQLNVTSANPFELAEFEVYGAGFPPGGLYLSEIIDLGEVANFSRLFWTIETLRQEEGSISPAPDADARVSIRMRTGRDDTPEVFYEIINVFTGDTQEVSKSDHGRLGLNVRGPVEDDQDNWSEWSAPFADSGQQIDLPSPRRFFQIEIGLESRSLLDGIRVNSLTVEHSIPPLAQQLIGEISVLEDPRPLGDKPRVSAGAPTTFAYDVRADIIGADVGFDAIEIFTPAEPQFKELFIGNPPISVMPDNIIEGPESLTLFFPSQRLTTESQGDLRIVFDAQVFVQATFFNAQVFDTQSDEAPQKVLPGDANPTVLTNNLRVLTTAASAQNLLPFFQVQPGIVTPNGDGANEQTDISYTLVQLQQPVQIDVDILDISGRRVRTLFSDMTSSGSFTWAWDGRDDGGRTVPPGIYLARVAVDAERERFIRLGTVGVVY
jgi:hypothetical protein